jgi:hypothetical protein
VTNHHLIQTLSGKFINTSLGLPAEERCSNTCCSPLQKEKGGSSSGRIISHAFVEERSGSSVSHTITKTMEPSHGVILN